MSAFSDKMKATSNRLLQKYGALTTVTRPVPGSYNTATSTVSFSSATTYTGYGNPQPYDVLEMVNSDIQTSDLKFLFYSTTQPTVNDIFTIGGIDYRALKVDMTTVNGTNVCYTIQLRV